MRISDWSSDVCSSDLIMAGCEVVGAQVPGELEQVGELHPHVAAHAGDRGSSVQIFVGELVDHGVAKAAFMIADMMREAQPVGDRARVANILSGAAGADALCLGAMVIELKRHADHLRSEEHTSELQSLMRISYAVFCLKKHNYNI